MTDKEIVQALRCTSTPGGPTGDCEKCPYWKTEQLTAEQKEKLGVDTWTSCDIDKVGTDAADLIERLTAENAALREKVPKWIMARDLYGRLKAYEDIAELCGGFDRLRELAEADKDGRVIILPCKVYETDGVRVYEHTVREVIYETAGGPAFDKNAIGKRIFLTRDEAERAIQEMEGKKDG